MLLGTLVDIVGCGECCSEFCGEVMELSAVSIPGVAPADVALSRGVIIIDSAVRSFDLSSVLTVFSIVPIRLTRFAFVKRFGLFTLMLENGVGCASS